MFFCFKQKTAYEMRISDWSSYVCSSDLFGDEPALAPIIAVEGEHQPEYPDDDQRRIQDDPPQPVLALDPFLVLVGPDERLLVIDEKARHHEQAGHQKDHENDMRGFDPKHRRPQKTCQFHRLSAANALDRKSTRLNSSH